MDDYKFIPLLYVPTLACNMACKYCYLEDNTNELKTDKKYVETLQFTDELILDLKLKELQTELDFVQCTLNNYTNKKENILEQIKQLQEEKEKIKCI